MSCGVRTWRHVVQKVVNVQPDAKGHQNAISHDFCAKAFTFIETRFVMSTIVNFSLCRLDYRRGSTIPNELIDDEE